MIIFNTHERLNMSKILVKAGTYRNEKVVDTAFTLVKGFQTGKRGGFVMRVNSPLQ